MYDVLLHKANSSQIYFSDFKIFEICCQVHHTEEYLSHIFITYYIIHILYIYYSTNKSF